MVVSLLNLQHKRFEVYTRLSIGILSAHAAELLLKSLYIIEKLDSNGVMEEGCREEMLYEKHDLDGLRPGHELSKLYQYLSDEAMWGIYEQFIDHWPMDIENFLILLASENKHFEYGRYAYEFELSHTHDPMFIKELAESVKAYYEDKYLYILKKYLPS